MIFEDLISQNSAALPYYFLLFVRMSGMFMLSPIFGRKNVPAQMKIVLSLYMTVLLASVHAPDYTLNTSLILIFVIDIVKELAIGLALGYLTMMFFSITLMAGQIIDVEIGLGVGSLFDPQLNMQASVSGMLLNLLMLLYFLINNGHHRIIRILGASVIHVPVGKVSLVKDMALMIIEQFSLCFGLAASLMLPLIGAALLAEAALGMLTRAIPQMNAYMVGIPLKILVGLAVLFLMQPFYVNFCDKVFNHIFTASENWVGLMGVSR